MTETIADRWADYTLSLDLADIPEQVVATAKLHILDTLACAFGGFENGSRTAVEAAESDLPGVSEATIFGTGRRTSALNAILVNGSMVRFLDANDITVGGHDSEIIPGAIALCERQGRSGAELLTSTIIGYELAARFRLGAAAAGDSVNNSYLEVLGFNNDLRAGFVMPAVFGRLLGLDRGAIADAIGVSGSRSLLLCVIDASKEQNTLAKNVRFPLHSYLALVCTYLAQHGLTGPRAVIEGHMGFNETILDSKMDLSRLTEFDDQWFTLTSSIKGFSACYSTHGQVQAVVNLRNRVTLDLDSIDSIKLVTNSRSLWHTGNAETRRRVSNKETADHSSYYVAAIGLLYGSVDPEHYHPDLYNDPRVHALMDKITIEADDARYKAVYPGSRVEVTMKDGTRYVEEALHPRGHHQNAMSDEDVSRKFRAMSQCKLSDEQQAEVIETVRTLERQSDLSQLMSALTMVGADDRSLNSVAR